MGRSAGYTVERRVTESITALLANAKRGDRAATDAVFAALYEELHRMARRELARRGGNMTVSATTLLHDAYLNIAKREGVTFLDRNHYMGYACRVMRRLIIDYARIRQAQKRGGHFEFTSIITDVADPMASADELTRISDALDELGTVDERLVRVVDLKVFCGFSFVEIADMLGVTERTIQRNWEKARIFLSRRLNPTL